MNLLPEKLSESMKEEGIVMKNNNKGRNEKRSRKKPFQMTRSDLDRLVKLSDKVYEDSKKGTPPEFV